MIDCRVLCLHVVEVCLCAQARVIGDMGFFFLKKKAYFYRTWRYGVCRLVVRPIIKKKKLKITLLYLNICARQTTGERKSLPQRPRTYSCTHTRTCPSTRRLRPLNLGIRPWRARVYSIRTSPQPSREMSSGGIRFFTGCPIPLSRRTHVRAEPIANRSQTVRHSNCWTAWRTSNEPFTHHSRRSINSRFFRYISHEPGIS
jgi:hypothetical protein